MNTYVIDLCTVGTQACEGALESMEGRVAELDVHAESELHGAAVVKQIRKLGDANIRDHRLFSVEGIFGVFIGVGSHYMCVGVCAFAPVCVCKRARIHCGKQCEGFCAQNSVLNTEVKAGKDRRKALIPTYAQAGDGDAERSAEIESARDLHRFQNAGQVEALSTTGELVHGGTGGGRANAHKPSSVAHLCVCVCMCVGGWVDAARVA